MAKPTKAQLKKINKFSHVELEEDQVFVFNTLAADTLPVSRQGWSGEYSINFTEKMLNKLKRDYRAGVGLLASHDSDRLPFGRTYDADVRVDDVGGESVKTMYIDHYIVTHAKDDEGNKVPLKTEIQGMTTQDIVNHIEVGHTFDTSIGFSVSDVRCSICGNDVRSWEACEHLPGRHYLNDATGEKERCNIIANDGEGIENSLVYSGAVNRATIQKDNTNQEGLSVGLHSNVKPEQQECYIVTELKNIPANATIFCRYSKGNLQMFTDTPERGDYHAYMKLKEEGEKMSNTTTPQVGDAVAPLTIDYAKYVDKEAFDKVEATNVELTKELDETKLEVATLTEELSAAKEANSELLAKAELADQYRSDLVEEALSAGVAARGNAFNKERHEKYLSTLAVEEIKEEIAAFKAEFPGTVKDARVTSSNAELSKYKVEFASKDEMRQEAAKLAYAEYLVSGGDLAELTKAKYAEILATQSK